MSRDTTPPMSENDTPIVTGAASLNLMGTKAQPADLVAYASELESIVPHLKAQADRWRFIANEMGYEPNAHAHPPLPEWLSDRIAKFRGDATRQAPSQATGAEWRSMDTAPMDGSFVIVSAGDVVGLARWDAQAYGGTWWWVGTHDKNYYDDPIEETNAALIGWMPLPEPMLAHPKEAPMTENDIPVVTGAGEALTQAAPIDFRDWLVFCRDNALHNRDVLDPKAAEILAAVLDRYDTEAPQAPSGDFARVREALLITRAQVALLMPPDCRVSQDVLSIADAALAATPSPSSPQGAP